MLPKKRRVTTALFGEILQKGMLYHTEHISMRIQKTASQPSRFSVVVPKKVYKRAVDRNKAKRQLNQALFERLIHVPEGFKGIMFIKKGFIDLSSQEIRTELSVILEKALHISLS